MKERQLAVLGAMNTRRPPNMMFPDLAKGFFRMFFTAVKPED